MRLLLLLVLLLGGTALAQLQLIVDGRPVGEVRNDLVPGSSFAPLSVVADGFGAEVMARAGEGTVALSWSGRIVQVEVVEEAGATNLAGAVRRDGRPAGDRAALRVEEEVWLPVRDVAVAFGARVGYLAERRAVTVITPRAELEGATLQTSAAGDEWLRLRFSGPARYSRFRNEALGLWQFRFERVDLARAQTLRGETFGRVDLIPDRGDLDVRVDVGGAPLEVQSLPAGPGFELRVRVQPEADDEEPDEADAEPGTVVLDPGHGGEDRGLDLGAQREAGATLSLAQGVASRLRAEGFTVRLTRTGPAGVPVASRSAAGAGADLFLSLHAADLPPGELRAWVLGDPADGEALESAVRRNARDALEAGVEDELRRAVLLDLVPDLEVGPRQARRIGDALFGMAGYRLAQVGEAPLAVLEGAAGRGVLLEFSAGDLADEALAEALAEAIAAALGDPGS